MADNENIQQSPTVDPGATMDAMMSSAPAAQPSQDQKSQAAAQDQRDAAFFGMDTDNAAEREAHSSARDYIAGRTPQGDQPRDESGRFTGKEVKNTGTRADADYANDATDDVETDEAQDQAEDDTDRASAGDEGEGADAGDAGDDDGSGILASLGVKVSPKASKSIDALMNYADRLAATSEERGKAAQKAPEPKAEEPKKAAEATGGDEDEEDQPLTKAELDEIKDSEGVGAWLKAKEYNLAIKQRREAREARQAEQGKQGPDQRQQSVEQQRKQLVHDIDNVILPSVYQIVKDIPALSAVYGKPGTTREKVLDKHAEAIEQLYGQALDLMRKSEFAADRERPLTLKEAMDLALVRKHGAELKKAIEVKNKREQATVQRHGSRSLAAGVGGGRGGTDAVSEASKMAKEYLSRNQRSR